MKRYQNYLRARSEAGEIRYIEHAYCTLEILDDLEVYILLFNNVYNVDRPIRLPFHNMDDLAILDYTFEVWEGQLGIDLYNTTWNDTST